MGDERVRGNVLYHRMSGKNLPADLQALFIRYLDLYGKTRNTKYYVWTFCITGNN